jgi:RNA polymerase sigma-70 factor (ECF subfamily)
MTTQTQAARAAAPPEGPDDRALMAAVARGDEGAFGDLVRRWSGRLFAAAHRILGSRADAEDAVQRALLQVFRSAPSYRPEWAVSTWLYRITTNQCVDELRRRGARREVGEEAVPLATAGGHGPSSGLRLDVRRALGKVPREARILLVLCYAEGLSYREMARVRGIKVNTVKSQIARGKSILRAALEGGRGAGGKDGAR